MQANLFDAPAPASATHREGIALGDRVTWQAGKAGERAGIVVYAGPRMAFFGMSEFWRSEQDHAEFLKFPGLLRGDKDAWLHRPGQLLIARNTAGWWPIGDGVAAEKANG